MATATVDTRKFLSETKFYEAYSRYKEDDNRYETWDEAVDRVIGMHEDYYKNKGNELAGYFELIFHKEKDEVEIAYLGLLKEYHNQKLGSYLLSSAIHNSFLEKPRRVWVHTCSLDHKNALNNYLSRGMKIFKKETISI